MLCFFCFKQEAGYHAEALAISYDFGGREVFAAGRGLAAASQVARRREVEGSSRFGDWLVVEKVRPHI